MQPEYTDKAQTALDLARRSAISLGQSYIGTEHILLGLVKENTGVAAHVLMDNGVTAEQLESMISDLLAPDRTNVMLADRKEYSPRAKNVIEEAYRLAEHFKSEKIGTEHLLLAILKESDSIALRLLVTLGLSVSKVYSDVLISMGVDPASYRDAMNMAARGKKGSAGILEKYSRDLTALAKEGKLDPVIGRNDEIQRVIQILSRRTKNNPCLIGEPGVGKTAIVEGLASRIVSGEVPFTVQNKRVLTLDLSGMVAGSKYRGEFEERIKKVMSEVIEDGSIILFLDEIHTLIGAGGAEGAIDASNILKPSLARGEIQLIGATTITEYRKYVEKDAALERRLQPVTIEEPNVEETIRILQGVVSKYEQHHKVTITEEALVAAATLSDRYINDRNLPDKAIDLIDEAAAAVRLHTTSRPEKLTAMAEEISRIDDQIVRSMKMEAFGQAGELRRRQIELKKKYEKAVNRFEANEQSKLFTVTGEDIASVVSMWTKIPLKRLEEKESERLLKLEDTLHKRVIGQEEAVKALSMAIRRGRVGLQDPHRPIGSFLFLGPTGVGKTELCKALAEAMFGSDNALIRVDMSEYMEGHAVSKMIGSPPGYVGFDEGGQLSEKIRNNPYSVVLFDEIEKAHPDVFNILLQVLDDGHITDSKGRKVSFKNTVLVMTSNAGATRIMEPKNLGFGAGDTPEKSYAQMKSAVMDEVKKIFKPEFINRIDEIMVFHPLSHEDLQRVVKLLASNLTARCRKQMGIELTMTAKLNNYLVDKFSDPKMGARPLKRAIQSFVENELSSEILSGNIKEGDRVTATVRDEKVKFTVRR